MPSVSVVVPVFNPGPWIEPCIRSILGQSLPRAEYEAIFVDDGSTDGTAERLDRLAEAEPGVSVIHSPPSGAPGRPRNIGIAAARGTYIQFLDADDELAPDALERLLAMAHRNHSDIVVGRFVSETLVRSQELFERSVQVCTVADTPELLGGSLGPTKLFRTEFLRGNEITFPEDWSRMEDQAFTLRAYLRARVISVLGGSPCYRFNRRSDSGNISLQPVDAQRHVENVGRLLDLAEAETIPGRLRDRVQRRVLTSEVLARIEDLDQQSGPEDNGLAMVRGLSEIARRRIGQDLQGTLAPLQQVEVEILRRGDPPQVVALARRLDQIVLEPAGIRATWTHGRLALSFTADLLDSATKLSVATRCEGPVARLSPDFVRGLGGLSTPATTSRAQLAIVIRHASLVEHLVGARVLVARSSDGSRADQRNGCSLSGRAELAINDMAQPRADLPAGRWDVLTRLDWLGFRRVAACLAETRAPRSPDFVVPGPAIVGRAGRVVVPFVDDAGLALDVDRTVTSLTGALAGRAVTLLAEGTRIALGLEIATSRAQWSLPVEMILRARDRDHLLPATLRPANGLARLEASLTGAGAPREPGAYALVARLDGPAGPELPLGEATLGADGRWMARGPSRVSALDQRRDALEWAARQARRTIVEHGRGLVASPRAEQLARRIVARSPRRLQVTAEAAFRRLRRR